MAENELAQVESRIAEQQQRALIPTGQDTGLTMDLLSGFGDRLLRESHSFSGTPEDVLRSIGMANSPDCINIADHLDKPIKLANWYMHETGKEGSYNGEVRNVIRTVLFDDDGKRYSTTSDWVAKDLYRVAFMRGRGTLRPPYVCKIVAVKGGQFGKVFRMVPA